VHPHNLLLDTKTGSSLLH